MHLYLNNLLTDWLFPVDDKKPYEGGVLHQNQMDDPEVYWKFQEELNRCDEEDSDDNKLPDIPPV